MKMLKQKVFANKANIFLLLTTISTRLYNKYSKGSDSMVKEIEINLTQNPIWGGVI